MAYCTVDHVAGEFKSVSFSTTTAITTSEVERFIAEEDAYINSRLSKRYETPITGAEALLIVRKISIGLVAGRVQRIMKVKTAEEPTNQDGQSLDLGAGAKKMLEMIVNDEMRLPDNDLATTHQGIQSFNVDESVEPVFEQGVDQW